MSSSPLLACVIVAALTVVLCVSVCSLVVLASGLVIPLDSYCFAPRKVGLLRICISSYALYLLIQMVWMWMAAISKASARRSSPRLLVMLIFGIDIWTMSVSLGLCLLRMYLTYADSMNAVKLAETQWRVIIESHINDHHDSDSDLKRRSSSSRKRRVRVRLNEYGWMTVTSSICLVISMLVSGLTYMYTQTSNSTSNPRDFKLVRMVYVMCFLYSACL